jgi:hypothetical protein
MDELKTKIQSRFIVPVTEISLAKWSKLSQTYPDIKHVEKAVMWMKSTQVSLSQEPGDWIEEASSSKVETGAARFWVSFLSGSLLSIGPKPSATGDRTETLGSGAVTIFDSSPVASS